MGGSNVIVANKAAARVRVLDCVIEKVIRRCLPSTSISVIGGLNSSALGRRTVVNNSTGISTTHCAKASLANRLTVSPVASPALTFRSIIGNFSSGFGRI